MKKNFILTKNYYIYASKKGNKLNYYESTVSPNH